jgi:hypothetical protein
MAGSLDRFDPGIVTLNSAQEMDICPRISVLCSVVQAIR